MKYHKIIIGGFILQGLLWTILASLYLIHQDSIVIFLLLLMDLALHFLAAWIIYKNGEKGYMPGFVLIIVNIILTITDQMGIWDYTVLVIYSILLVLTGISRFTNKKTEILT